MKSAAAARRDLPTSGRESEQTASVAGVALAADVAGGLYWPEERLLAVADLHLEKGSSFAARGSLLPPYDTHDTVWRLAALIRRYDPRVVVALGDNFHDRRAAARLAASDLASLAALRCGREWVWIAGNHDPDPADALPGTFTEELAVGPLTFRHEPAPEAAPGEISGHLHPVAVVGARGRSARCRCFVGDGRRMVMPAFGAYAGGLNVRHRAFRSLFREAEFVAHVMGETRVYAIAGARCLAD